ncbi:phosphoribosyl-ATP diphosphatase [Thauera chlorobenzoica]|uniref:Phosphoribosyl-ATP pyrophosphatase n=1 Tax=Thauera chlorobenzoica TaxID=96773 RepID=A0A1H5URC9_9RHOO|nr:phosphoribosyl-ATP diphosphatase [Thauera chlorobenzoica]APR03503.1 Phosphoribosyl-ATP pyrophosphatase [Thauera chlorobenzoica]SEF76998.1 phosphoribosyl-ATP pyrophosphatase [Thauera chlorobenzoica]
MIDIEVLRRVSDTLVARKQADPDASYVSSLYAKGTDAICKKVAEEAAETIMAAKDKDRLHLVWEVTDLWFHSLVLLAHHGLSVEDVIAEFRRREGVSGIDEKKSRTAQVEVRG